MNELIGWAFVGTVLAFLFLLLEAIDDWRRRRRARRLEGPTLLDVLSKREPR